MAFATEHKLAVYLIEQTDLGFAARHTPELAPYLVRSQP